MPRTRTSGRPPSTRTPTASRHSASSHHGRASSAARATMSSGVSSATNAAASSRPSTTARSRVRGAPSRRAAPSAATMRSTFAPPVVTGSGTSPRTTPSPTGASEAARTADVSGPSGSCGQRPATSGWEGPTPLPRRGPLDPPGHREGPPYRRARRRCRSGDPDGAHPTCPASRTSSRSSPTAGELEDHISAMTASLDALGPYLPAASDSASEPGDGVRP